MTFLFRPRASTVVFIMAVVPLLYLNWDSETSDNIEISELNHDLPNDQINQETNESEEEEEENNEEFLQRWKKVQEERMRNFKDLCKKYQLEGNNSQLEIVLE